MKFLDRSYKNTLILSKWYLVKITAYPFYFNLKIKEYPGGGVKAIRAWHVHTRIFLIFDEVVITLKIDSFLSNQAKYICSF